MAQFRLPQKRPPDVVCFRGNRTPTGGARDLRIWQLRMLRCVPAPLAIELEHLDGASVLSPPLRAAARARAERYHAQPSQPPSKGDPKVRETFDSFVGETFYGQMLQSLRKTVGKTPYFNGGRGEEVFRSQLDQTLAQSMAKANANQFTGSMFELFNLQRS